MAYETKSKNKYITYDKKGVVTRYKFLKRATFTAQINKGVVDVDNGKEIRTIRDFRE